MQEESNWIGRFAVDVAVAYKRGTERGEYSQLSALGVEREDFFTRFGEMVNDLILGHRREAQRLAWARAAAASSPSQGEEAFKIDRSVSDPKTRWVDGTPEYSFYISAIRKLFPGALFIYLVRDVNSVVRSMLTFSPADGPRLAETEQRAYVYWLRTSKACFQAEQAYGSQVVRRLRHSDLIDHPKASLQSLLEFLNEPYEAACLEPLQSRINSSNVASDFDPSDPKTDQRMVDEARQLNSQLLTGPARFEPSVEKTAEVEKAFERRVVHISNLEADYVKGLERVAALEREVEELRARLKGHRIWRNWMYPKTTREIR